jgi:Holliday junction resolvase RusA-like endonuclease
VKPLAFRIPIEPRGKDRPKGRMVKGRKPFIQIYTPTKTTKWEKSFALAVRAKIGRASIPEDIPIDVAIVAIFSRPAYMAKVSKVSGDLLGGWLRSSYLHSKKPDADNVAKIVLDSLSEWFDDERVAVLTVRKFIAATDEPPGVYVRIREADEMESSDAIASL